MPLDRLVVFVPDRVVGNTKVKELSAVEVVILIHKEVSLDNDRGVDIVSVDEAKVSDKVPLMLGVVETHTEPDDQISVGVAELWTGVVEASDPVNRVPLAEISTV